MSDKTRSVLYNGLIVHEHSKLSHFHEVTFCYDIIQEKSYTPQQVQSMEETRNIITGTLDDLINVNGNFVICDKKTFNGNGYIKTRPDPQYKRQLSIYRVLLESSYGIDARFGCLLYLDKTKDLQETPVSFELDDLESTKQFLKDTLEKLQSIPEPNVCFLCNGMNKTKTIYCPYKEICQSE
ncbi:PD-D/EXK nuclease superfamily protein [Marine Group I thaumarchaeote SCGC AAA799-E16]|uniref:PD-D/EXK nuclease superfamily protein n=2 Tax=Marine Group I TaxID=905826 RepID=A0A087RXV1_9ARCH|nr:PD-D/EXK nuclease superfamily protein [Marine Group I thaumarchaeote SCGC AAA799-E16]KFM18305.1 PD-D/EXK nuclease superfamily protein [Marine Group I thaumarchaeote SCGC RSA3]